MRPSTDASVVRRGDAHRGGRHDRQQRTPRVRHRTGRGVAARPRRRPQARLPHGPAQAVVGLRRQGRGARVHGRPVHRPGRRADVLRGAGVGARAAGARVDPRARRRRREGRRVGAQERRGRRAADHPRHDQAARRERRQHGQGRVRARHRCRAGPVVGVRLRGRVLAVDEPHLRDRGGAPDLEAAPRDAGCHRHHRAARGPGRREPRPVRADRAPGGRARRPRGHRDRRLAGREVAGRAPARRHPRRAALPPHAEHQAAQVPLGQPGRDPGDPRLGRRLGGVRPLPRQRAEQLRRDLRHPRGRHHLPPVALADEPRAPARRRARRRGRAQPRAAERHARGGAHPAPAARHPRERQEGRQA